MIHFLERILDSSMFSPHGICLLWEPEPIWLHVVSDALIALAMEAARCNQDCEDIISWIAMADV
jgi:hypothetical protein